MAKYKKRSSKKLYDDGGDLSYNGNPVTDQSKAKPDYGKYLGYATSAAQVVGTGIGAYNTFNNSQATDTQKGDALYNTAVSGVSAVNPVVGGFIGAGDAIGAPIKQSAERTNSQGELNSRAGSTTGYVAGTLLNPAKTLMNTQTSDASTGQKVLSGLTGGISDVFFAKGYNDRLEGDAKANIAAQQAEYSAQQKAQEDYQKQQQDYINQQIQAGLATDQQSTINPLSGLQSVSGFAYGGSMRGRNYCAEGGELTQYEGLTHEQGGLPLGQTNEVETGETRGPNDMMSVKDYIYSDRLKVPGKKYTFAKASKMIESKLSKRDNDKMSDETREKMLSELMQNQESVRQRMMDSAYKKAYGGEVKQFNPQTQDNSTVPKNKTNDIIFQDYMNQFPEYNHPGNEELLKRRIQEIGKDAALKEFNQIAYKVTSAAFGGDLGDPTTKKIDTVDSFNKELSNYKKIDVNRVPGHVAQYVSEAITPYLKSDNAALDAALRKKYNLAPDAPITGKNILSYDESNKALSGKYGEYLNRYEAYNNYRSKTALEPRKSAPMSTPSFGFETPKPAYDSVKSNLFTPYNPPTFGYGGRMKYDNGSYLQPMEDVEDPQFNEYVARKSSLDEYANMVDRDIASGTFNSPNSPYTNGERNGNPSQAYNGNPQIRQNNFNPDNLYNVGNFLGASYDIYRGLKGGDPVDYERVTPENVDYSVARDAITSEINQGFQNNKKTFKNVNNAAQYLSLVTQGAANRDSAISDAISQSYENERNTNAQINNQSKYFNAQTQKGETDARQLEKDVASNTLSTGLYNAGLGLSQAGRDKKAYLSQDQAKRLLGTGDYSYTYDKKGRVAGIKFNKTGEVTPIQ